MVVSDSKITISRQGGWRSVRGLLAFLLILAGGAAAEPAASQPDRGPVDFHDVAVDKLPEDLMILGGEFAIQQEGGKKFLELAPDPLDTCGFLFGPADFTTGQVSALIWGQASGKRYPEFGIGSNDTGGYKLWLIPGQNRLELRKGDETKANCTYTWNTGDWTHFKLRIEATAEKHWRIAGKAWRDGSPEPGQWMLSMDESDAPAAGRASVWGVPYSGKPLRIMAISSAQSSVVSPRAALPPVAMSTARVQVRRGSTSGRPFTMNDGRNAICQPTRRTSVRQASASSTSSTGEKNPAETNGVSPI